MWSMKFWSILREVDIEILVSLRNLLTFYEIQPKDHNRYSTKSFSVRHTVDIFLRQPPEQCPETTIPKNFSSAKITLGCAVLSHFSRVWLFATPWTVACQATLSMWFSRQEYWSGLPFSSLGDPPDPGIKTTIKTTSPALAGRFFTIPTREAHDQILYACILYRHIILYIYMYIYTQNTYTLIYKHRPVLNISVY